MPDISGFTQFVTETEILHSQHIIQELLEILIDSNHLNLEICEVEGDAIFFYKTGSKPALAGLLKQVEKMFTRFHAHLKLYQHQRICRCSACKSATDLSLKIVAHFGEVAGIAVKDHKKLFGKDVILIHRLLKNNLNKKEYVLFTENLLKEAGEANLPAWYQPQLATEQYDTGEIQFYYSDLCDLHKNIQPEFPVYNSSTKTYMAFSDEEMISASMEEVFETILGLQEQASSPGKKNRNDTILRVGEKHPCLITRNNNINITESVKIEEETIQMIEMNDKGIAGYRYILKKISAAETMLSIQMLIKDNPFFRFAFSIGMKSRMKKRVHEFFGKLKEFLRMEERTMVDV
jgi:hypothetical protein